MDYYNQAVPLMRAVGTAQARQRRWGGDIGGIYFVLGEKQKERRQGGGGDAVGDGHKVVNLRLRKRLKDWSALEDDFRTLLASNESF